MYSFTILVAGTCFIVAAQAKCDAGCTVPVKHYEELGCEPVYAKPDDCCPTHYNCAKIEGRATDKCYFKGQVYNKRDKIDNQLTSSNCAAACFCEKNDWNDITCATIECPEFFGHSKLEPGCFRVYEDNACCSSKTVCPPLDKLAKCEFDGKTYHDGQRFEAGSDTCLSCTCKAGFAGKLVEPFCKPINCGIELRNSKSANKNCAPVFYGTSRCCPIQWQCHSDSDKIEKAKETSTFDKTCQYGTQTLKIGDKVILERSSKFSPEINCECRMPPMLTCIQKPHSDK